jgi:hypothetical protein
MKSLALVITDNNTTFINNNLGMFAANQDHILTRVTNVYIQHDSHVEMKITLYG